MQFNVNQTVVIKEFRNDQYNCEGRVTAISDDKQWFHVSNMNMPFMGTISKWFSADELERK